MFTHGGAGGVVECLRPSPWAAQTHLITAQWSPRAHQHYSKTLAAFNAPRLPSHSHHTAHTHTHTGLHGTGEGGKEEKKKGGRAESGGKR